MILSKGTTSYRKSGLKILSARNALVSVPGTAIFRLGYIFRLWRLARNQDRSIVISDRSAVRQHAYLSCDVGISVKADGGDIVGSAHGFFIQRLNVFENMSEVEVPVSSLFVASP